MPAGRKRALDPDDAMPVIVDMFWHGGFDGSTLDQIAAELGITKPTLCRTLGDKEAIFAAALEAYHGKHIEPAQHSFDHAESLLDGLESVLTLFAERTLNNELPDGCFMGDVGSSGDFVAGRVALTLSSLQGRLVASVHGRVEQALADGELAPSTEVDAVVQYILGQFAAISAISRSRPTRTQLESVVRYMLDGLPWATTS
ncbi:MAG: AcrR family transcriptional regulator [Candidatus Poriferisodalaceae bacterium]|jgi:AcrR family transcriptional regulator